MRILAALGITLLLLVGIASPVSAGFEPTPFKVHRLNMMAYQLNAINARINAVLSTPPDDQRPSPRGLVRMLNFTARRIDRLHNRVNAVLGTPPDDQMPNPRVLAALTNVRDAAQGIVKTLNAVLSSPPDDQMPNPRMLRALRAIGDAAQGIVDLANEYNGYPGTVPGN
jgi:hypothetical protein